MSWPEAAAAGCSAPAAADGELGCAAPKTRRATVAVAMTRDDGKQSAANTALADPPDAAAPTSTSTTVAARHCRALSSDDPLRLWVGGDSLAGSLGPALGELTGSTGVVQPYFDSRVSSGLANPGFFDWPDHATTEMTRLDPDVVVFIIGTNDYTDVSGDWKGDGVFDPPGASSTPRASYDDPSTAEAPPVH